MNATQRAIQCLYMDVMGCVNRSPACRRHLYSAHIGVAEIVLHNMATEANTHSELWITGLGFLYRVQTYGKQLKTVGTYLFARAAIIDRFAFHGTRVRHCLCLQPGISRYTRRSRAITHKGLQPWVFAMVHLGEVEYLATIHVVPPYPNVNATAVSDAHRRHTAFYGMSNTQRMFGQYVNYYSEPPLYHSEESAAFPPNHLQRK